MAALSSAEVLPLPAFSLTYTRPVSRSWVSPLLRRPSVPKSWVSKILTPWGCGSGWYQLEPNSSWEEPCYLIHQLFLNNKRTMAAKAASVQSEYMFSRSFRDSARQAASYHPSCVCVTELPKPCWRLHLQHWIWKERLGYLLHPSIPTSSPNCRVADIGTGNAYDPPTPPIFMDQLTFWISQVAGY